MHFPPFQRHWDQGPGLQSNILSWKVKHHLWGGRVNSSFGHPALTRVVTGTHMERPPAPPTYLHLPGGQSHCHHQHNDLQQNQHPHPVQPLVKWEITRSLVSPFIESAETPYSVTNCKVAWLTHFYTMSRLHCFCLVTAVRLHVFLVLVNSIEQKL